MKRINSPIALLLLAIPALQGMDSAPQPMQLDTLKELITACDVDGFKQTYEQAELSRLDKYELVDFALEQNNTATQEFEKLSRYWNKTKMGLGSFCIWTSIVCATGVGIKSEAQKEKIKPATLPYALAGTYFMSSGLRNWRKIKKLKIQLESLSIIIDFLVLKTPESMQFSTFRALIKAHDVDGFKQAYDATDVNDLEKQELIHYTQEQHDTITQELEKLNSYWAKTKLGLGALGIWQGLGLELIRKFQQA